MTASNDLVALLRRDDDLAASDWPDVIAEAADHIEALEAEVAALVEDMGRLRERETYYLNRAEALEAALRDVHGWLPRDGVRGGLFETMRARIDALLEDRT